jgi:ATP-dependent Clp protease ATP-binding subunit ClpC
MDVPKAIEELLTAALLEANRAKAEALEPAHVFVAALKVKSSPLPPILESQHLDAKYVRRRVRTQAYRPGNHEGDEPKRISSRVWRILDNARGRAEALKREPTVPDLLIALLRYPDNILEGFFSAEYIPVATMIDALEKIDAPPPSPPVLETTLRTGEVTPTPILDQFGKDYTAMARQGLLDPVIGRRDETKQMVRILLQKQKNNPVLIGEAGVGKTSIVEGLAQRIVEPGAPDDIRKWRIVEISLASLVAGTTYRGQFEERLQGVIDEAIGDRNLILFIDELHTLIGAGSASGSLDAANILKPELARGRLRLIGATTTNEYRQHIEKDAALERRFQPVRVDEPTADQTREILGKLRAVYEAHHGVDITDEALAAAVAMSIKYLPDRRLPDKARDLLDRAAVAKRFFTFSPNKPPPADGNRVTAQDVAAVVAEWTGIPVESLGTDELARLRDIENILRQRVIGQDHAIDIVAQSIKAARSGLSDPSRPDGVFLFMGPTGVGKTELAKALAEFLFDGEDRLIRFDMSEYMEDHAVSKLIGAPPGYVGHDQGGALTDAVRAMPYCVLLFDEIEKAHPRVSDLFLQIFDDGRLTDAHGRTADFRHSVIILTSNLREAADRKPIPGFRPADEVGNGALLDSINLREVLLGRFRPELVNRIGRVIQFNSLGPDQMRSIIDKLLKRISQRVADRQIALEPSPLLFDALMKLGYRPEWGAREMERVIERNIVQPLAQGLIAGEFNNGDDVIIASDGHEITLRSGTRVYKKPDTLTTGEVLLTTMRPAAREEVTMLLFDVVSSSEIVKQQGDTFMMMRMQELQDTIRAHRTAGQIRFMKFTGDGFLVLFDSVSPAVELAHRLRSSVQSSNLRLRFVIHHGSVRVQHDGDPIGAEVHRLFRIEALTQDDCVSPGTGSPLPKHSLIVITPNALDQLPEPARAEFDEIGDFALKGFDDPQTIWAERG